MDSISGSGYRQLLCAAAAKIRVVAAYLLALLGGNPSPNAKDTKKILGSVGEMPRSTCC